ncbi:hypothetical protein C8R44DRAFT_806662, partial [Mycena epipterygia]
MLPAILFNPSARVYNLRLLLLATVSANVCTIALFDSYTELPRSFAFVVCPLILAHHILVLFPGRVPMLAVLDLALLVIEIGVVSLQAYLNRLYYSSHWQKFVLFPLQLVALGFSALFRLGTIINSKDKYLSQRFLFLGGCVAVYPAYNPLSIILNRSLLRPLVRSESKIIMFARAVILSCLALAVPAFGIYSIFVLPTVTQVYLRSLPVDAGSFPAGNVTVLFQRLDSSAFNTTGVIQITVNGEINCSVTPVDGDVWRIWATCSDCSWIIVDSISISMELAAEMGGIFVYIFDVENDYLPLFDPTTIIFLGSSLVGSISWTEIQQRNLRFGGMSVTYRSSFIPRVTNLQPYPLHAAEANIAKLMLFNTNFGMSEVLQETVDASTLSGIATFGGFWTFVNGTFALIFGANVVYFLFGRRPLSALGVVHIFERRRLAREWRRDFPALHSEGGLPGSESAGIVAFLRERLVDLGSGHSDDPKEVEAQTQLDRDEVSEADRVVDGEDTGEKNKTPSSSNAVSRSRQSGYLLDAGYHLDHVRLPLMDVDLGAGETE